MKSIVSLRDVLYYDDYYGDGEMIRMMFAHADYKYTDIRLNSNDRALFLENQPLNKLPCVMHKLEKEYYWCGNAILRMYGIKLGYYVSLSDNTNHMWQIDSAVEYISDCTNTILTTINESQFF